MPPLDKFNSVKCKTIEKTMSMKTFNNKISVYNRRCENDTNKIRNKFVDLSFGNNDDNQIRTFLTKRYVDVFQESELSGLVCCKLIVTKHCGIPVLIELRQ